MFKIETLQTIWNGNYLQAEQKYKWEKHYNIEPMESMEKAFTIATQMASNPFIMGIRVVDDKENIIKIFKDWRTK